MENTKIVFESILGEDGRVETREEDGGCAMIGEASFTTAIITKDGSSEPEYPASESEETEGSDGGIFVHLQSWHEEPDLVLGETHRALKMLKGKRIRVTIEVLD